MLSLNSQPNIEVANTKLASGVRTNVAPLQSFVELILLKLYSNEQKQRRGEHSGSQASNVCIFIMCLTIHYSEYHSESVFPISSCKPSLVGVLMRQIVKGGRCVFACWPFQSKASLSLSFLATALPLGSAGGSLREQASLLITTLCEFIIFAENCS